LTESIVLDAIRAPVCDGDKQGGENAQVPDCLARNCRYGLVG
jgi:hypothetical protein